MSLDEEYIKDTSHKRRVRQQALAILRRGIKAGIPERLLRTTKDTFKGMLCDRYHNDVEQIASMVFDNSNKLTKISNIIVDGGNSMVRHHVGCTILFRIIACDNSGTNQLHRCPGCDDCDHTGYHGRKAIYEILCVSYEIRKMIINADNDDKIKRQAIAEGMKTLRRDGIEQVLNGTTTLEELQRLVDMEAE